MLPLIPLVVVGELDEADNVSTKRLQIFGNSLAEALHTRNRTEKSQEDIVDK